MTEIINKSATSPEEKSSDAHNLSLKSVKSVKHQLIFERIFKLFSWCLFGYSLLSLFSLFSDVTYILGFIVAVIVLFTVGIFLTFQSNDYRELTPLKFLQKLNRIAPELEESAQLCLAKDSQLLGLRLLQKQKITSRVIARIDDSKSWRKPYVYKGSLLLTLLSVLVIFSGAKISITLGEEESTPPVELTDTASLAMENFIAFKQIEIIPPSYTKLKKHTVNQLDVEAYQGSQLHWQIEVKHKQGEFFLIFSNGEEYKFVANTNGLLQTSITAQRTGLYRVVQRLNKPSDDVLTEHTLSAMHSLTVLQDKKPVIKILTPKVSVTLIPKSAKTAFQVTALVTDDFVLDKVEIIASVAKGSGEAVKFRDETFLFDQRLNTERGEQYTKAWDLKHLGMEPGDEVYFKVIAVDNKAPEANVAKSSTIIVRWLDDDEQLMAADGIVIDFVPEYFKSQRQIIIETEQLIADQQELSKQQFSQTSYQLGHAQNDLKQKYGQYLGDEFGEGTVEQLGEHQEEHTDEHQEEHKEEKQQNHKEHGQEQPRPQASEEGHLHDLSQFENDKSGAAELVARFGHAHEAAIVDPVTTRNPKGLMKKAVSIMWQAELHLMLAEPELALPFEYEALKYIKLAKLADRIYVKRLGFEPPPVTEERRLTGDLSEIENLTIRELKSADLTKQDFLIRQAYQLLATPVPENAVLNNEQISLLREVSELLTTLSAQRPVLIKSAAIIENIIMAKQIHSLSCEQCLVKLQKALWQLLAPPIASPSFKNVHYLPQDPLIKSIENKEGF